MPKVSFAQRYLNAWNSHDPDRVLSFFTRDVTYIDSGLQCQVSGSGVGDYVERIFTLCPDAEFELLDGGAVGNGSGVVQWGARGHNLAQLCPQIGLPQLNSLCGLDYLSYDSGKLVSAHVYFDLAPFLTSQQPQQSPQTSTQQDYLNIDSPQSSSSPSPILQSQYQKSGITEQEIQHYCGLVNQVMQQEKLYLENDLTLPELAERLGLSTNHMSQVINSGFNFSFYELLNHYRIEQAKQLIKALPKDEKMVSLEIAFGSGFGSASAYYRAFQRHTRLTPKEFRKRYC